ncbi:MAG: MFS transporter [Saprospiraceae bacterium]|nr:MFS transporter [Saprospiraceae bacterium]MCB9319804.1 MFS transporter [Lewinellaceae bacterium]
MEEPGKTVRYTHVLIRIVLAQFLCTSLWFAGNAVLPGLTAAFDLGSKALGHLTSAVQLGFIGGTLVFAVLTIADRFSPSRVFFVCAVSGALTNVLITLGHHNLASLSALRFATGFCLAGIYPVGMKIASDYFEKGLGKALGFLVGALVLGTAFPHAIRQFSVGLPWKVVFLTTSALALLGGIIVWISVPDGPYRKRAQQLHWDAVFTVFKVNKFRNAAFGYFGHMWELYTFWAFVPVILLAHQKAFDYSLATSGVSFAIIGIGCLSCIAGGLWSQYVGPREVASRALAASGICCLISPLILRQSSPVLLVLFMLFWGIVVIADSPMFSTLIATNAPQQSRATALTIVNCIGFSITIVSIELLNFLTTVWDWRWIYIVLAPGPLLGLWALRNKTPDNKQV